VPVPELSELLQQAARGERAAMEVLLSRVYPKVRAMVHHQLERSFRRHHVWMAALFSTGDIVQEVFLEVVRGLGDVKCPNETEFAGWLAAQVQRRLIDAYRFHAAQRRDARRNLAIESGHGGAAAARDLSPSQHAIQLERWHRAALVMQGLSARQRALLELRLVDDRSWRDIAERLDYPSEDAARMAFASLRARLLAKLAVPENGRQPP
jgi:RNA polymerase sigma factor (sigma-70 family)